MPEYVMFIANDPEKRSQMSDEEFQAQVQPVFAWFEEHTRAGRVIEGSGRRLQLTGARTVRVDGGRAVVTDGPFAETKEVLGGYAVLDVPDMEAAVALAKTWPGTAALELRPVLTG